MGVGVSVKNKLLAGNVGDLPVYTAVVGLSLVHAAVGACVTDRPGLCGITLSVAGVDRVRPVPGHSELSWVSSYEMHTVVDGGNMRASDQHSLPSVKSAGVLNVDTVLDGTTNNLLAVLGHFAHFRENRVKAEHAEVSVCEDTCVSDTCVATFAELGKGYKGLTAHAWKDDCVEAERTKLATVGRLCRGSKRAADRQGSAVTQVSEGMGIRSATDGAAGVEYGLGVGAQGVHCLGSDDQLCLMFLRRR